MQSLQDTSIQFIKGVGPAKKKLFANLGIENIEDLFYFFPRRYEDRTQLTPIAKLKLGEVATISGEVFVKGARRSWFTKKHVSEVVVDDQSGRIFCIWFNQPYLENYFKPGTKAVFYGKVEMYKNRIQMVAPEYEIIDGDEKESLNIGRIVPIYPLTKGITQRYLRRIIRSCLDRFKEQLTDPLPVFLRNKYRLVNLKHSIDSIHFPENAAAQESALKRISFEEFFFFQLSVFLRRLSIAQKKGVAHKITSDFMREYAQSFPFELTKAQSRAINEITGDMQKQSPMLRLLQGDVGCGKTVVAFFGCVAAVKNGLQAAFMAPTEILARQHYETIGRILASGPFKNLRAALLIGEISAAEKQEILDGLKKGAIDLVVGTHAILNEGVQFKNLSFAVIDEQHKFGVRQRALLSAKGSNPDVLIMTATPIPRSLCLTLYGDLDLSTIDEMPKGRGKVTTRLFYSEQAPEAYALIRQQVVAGQQVYIVYPIIEESETLDLKAAQAMFKHFQQHEFKDLRLGLIHGRLGKKESTEVMKKFKDKEIDILVATTVLEVGVDVPNANVMVIEHAERFGLSQLHQLRGRIGRGQKDGMCLLIAEPATFDGQERLAAILSSTNGFDIAQKDLDIRGPGEFFGRHQHGLNELRFANPATQMDILELARKEAAAIIQADPKLEQPADKELKRIIQRRYPKYLAMVEAG